ncbi:hypothetical protein LD125_00409 [Mesoplasma sp. JKS002658]|uniref:hypothetical protein n=1 Tax=Mesoplasma whartonense TaxID=2878854 RepID=UPI002022AB82|nr:MULTISPECIES: hypothetical protein [unclassified Mesoplasma]MCL8211473.1 hypothetical protein [Mesoplasma sp. JKS002664]MCL8212325.1 hypothetical protein [Mesoplasma sp. JKS002662]MCL8212414.1 hypothetical protein [Mesoplasma sp. JKS002661]MCL8213473.1 hypothetical protein [Mesoplasma sp. JKS002660]MCL8214146.1 hypothetical protein [Mesoplasma sp. JKS002658]
MDHQSLSGGAVFGIVIGVIIGLFLFIVNLVFLIQGIKYFILRQREIYKNNPDLLPEVQNQEEIDEKAS